MWLLEPMSVKNMAVLSIVSTAVHMGYLDAQGTQQVGSGMGLVGRLTKSTDHPSRVIGCTSKVQSRTPEKAMPIYPQYGPTSPEFKKSPQ